MYETIEEKNEGMTSFSLVVPTNKKKVALRTQVFRRNTGNVTAMNMYPVFYVQQCFGWFFGGASDNIEREAGGCTTGMHLREALRHAHLRGIITCISKCFDWY